MTKNFKLSYILSMVFFAIVIAWNTLTNFFGGVGLNFVALIAILSALLALNFLDATLARRTKEIFIAICVYAVLEFIIYFIFGFGIGNVKAWKVFSVFQNIFSFFAIFCFAYVVFRFIYELKGLKFTLSALFGKKPKEANKRKAKELSNGSLEDKPNHSNAEHTAQTEQTTSVEKEEE